MALTALDFPASPTVGQVYPDPPVTGQPQYSWNGSQWLSSKAAVTQIARTDALGWSGMQINGSMEVSQELGASGTSVSGKYPVDGWNFNKVGTSVPFSGQGSPTNLPGFSKSLFVTVGTAQPSMGAGDFVFLAQGFEGYRVTRLAWGTASAQSITIGFWTSHVRTGTYSVSIRNAAVSRSYCTTYTQNVSNTWEYKTITIPGCVDGVWAADNTTGFSLSFAIACGTTFIAPAANVWTTGNYLAAPGQVNGVTATSDVSSFTGVVVLPGIAAPTAAQSPLIMRPFDQELVTCQRYFQFMRACSGVTDANSFVAYAAFPVEMRSAPTLAIVGGSITNGVSLPGVGFLNITSIFSQSMFSRDGQAVFNTSAVAALKPGGLYPPSIFSKLTLDARL